ncbi:MAG TPA: hypothetical protein PLG55_01285 [Methanospirillum sp.]|uniref:Fic family protein n=1 Tax=Methanospirillum sp. TaxID=45200 RepID=UPI0009CC4D23|nr:hypothetical protein [Methanospirillum sp.]OQB57415.1 MAG: hypothetical protein BWX96_03182 [Bacteroidetes bacterium ADurb.Bin145]HPY59342.1 hypothetical protein [Methanospirillum sp.]
MFRELDPIEQWGTGFPRVIGEAAEQGLLEPVIEEIGMRVRVTVFLAENQAIYITEQVTEHVTEQVIRLLQCLNGTPLSVKEATSCLGLNHRPTFMHDYLKPAIDAEFAEMIQPDSPKTPTQKYRITKNRKKLSGNSVKRDG